MSASLTSLPPPASLVSWHSAGTSHRSKRALSRRQRKQLQIQPHAPGGCLPTVCGAAAFAQSTALGRHRSDDALGVVIVDQGWRTPESDEILLDVAACYGCAAGAAPAPARATRKLSHPVLNAALPCVWCL